MEQRAQGAIEYLLLIGAAVLVVAIVISFMIGIISNGQSQGGSANQDYNNTLNDINSLKRNP